MTPYVLYDRLTGEIVQTGECANDDYLALATETHALLSGVAADLVAHYVDVLADPPTLVAKPSPPGPWQQWDWTTHAWQPVIALARAEKAAMINAACKAAILSGFASSALGAEHHYPAKITDQQNLASSVLASLLPIPADWTTPFWCRDAAGEWAFRLHTAAQIQQVGRDAKAAILAAMGKNEVLQAQVAAAMTLESLDTITW